MPENEFNYLNDSQTQQTQAPQENPQSLDVNSFMKQIGSRFDTVSGELESHKKQNEELSSRLSKLAKVASGETDAPRKSALQEIDRIKRDAEKGGFSLTHELAAALEEVKSQLMPRDELEALKKEIAELKKANNPDEVINQTALYAIGGILQDQVQKLYGGERNIAMETAVGNQIMREIERLQKEAPEKWMHVRRNGGLQEKLVSHFLTKLIPTGVRNRMSQEREEAKGVTVDDLTSAWEESKSIQDEDRREEAQRLLRELAIDNGLMPQLMKSVSRTRSSNY